MSARKKLTDDQVQWACNIAEKRADLERQLAMLPTVDDMAGALGCSGRYLAAVLAGQTSRSVRRIRIVIHARRLQLGERGIAHTV